jgi:hypothetical protein
LFTPENLGNGRDSTTKISNRTWKEETNFLEWNGMIDIQHFLGTPQVADFGGWKEEATKFLVS